MTMLDNNMDEDKKEQLTKLVTQIIEQKLSSNFFTARKLTDTPTDDLMVVNRKYVNLNGTLANRPTSSVATMGQHYFATNTNTLITYNRSSSVWSNGVGSVVALG
jgi:hypothetical protein